MPETVVITNKGQQQGYWRRCWQYREVLWFTARRDFVVKYRQTLAGIVWLLARPASQVFIFTILFGVMAGFKTPGGIPYPLVVMSGVVVWHFFASIVGQSMLALLNNQNLITKVYFPRAILPIATILPNLIDLAINLVALGAMIVYYHWFHPAVAGWFGFDVPTETWPSILPSWRIVFLLVPISMVALIGVGLGFIFSAGSVKFRDFQQLLGFIMQFLYLLSPVAWSSQVVQDAVGDGRLPGWVQTLYYCNPLAVCLDLFRWCVMPAGYVVHQRGFQLGLSLICGLVLVLFGQWFFRRLEHTFADSI